MPEVPRLAVTRPGGTLPVPMAPIMLSPPPALTTTSAGRFQRLARSGRSVPGGSREESSGGHFIRERGVDEIEDVPRPGAAADIHQGGAGGVAVLHAEFAGEVKIEVVVRKEDGREPGEILRLVPFQPEDFRRGEAGEHVHADFFNHGLGAAEVGADSVAFSGGGGVAPELGGADDLAFVERDEAVLLAGDADAADLARRAAQRFEDLLDGGVDGLRPGGGILLEMARRQAGQDFVALRGGGDDAARIRRPGRWFWCFACRSRCRGRSCEAFIRRCKGGEGSRVESCGYVTKFYLRSGYATSGGEPR